MNGKRHGQGTYIFKKSGATYVGGYSSNVKSGKGKLRRGRYHHSASPALLYKGIQLLDGSES